MSAPTATVLTPQPPIKPQPPPSKPPPPQSPRPPAQSPAKPTAVTGNAAATAVTPSQPSVAASPELKRPPSVRNKQSLPQITANASSTAVVPVTKVLSPPSSSSSSSSSSSTAISPRPATVKVSASNDLSSLTQLLQQWMSRTDARFSHMENHMDTSFANLNKRFQQFESTLSSIQAQLNASSKINASSSSSTFPSTSSAASSTTPGPGPAAAPPAATQLPPGASVKARCIELGFDPTLPPPPVECKHDVFLSHRRIDSQDIMRAFKSALEPAGYSVYLDRDALVSTEDLMTSVAASATLLFFMSQHIFDSEWCLKELIQAVRYKRNILLVSVAGCWWLDPNQQLCEFPIHLFPSYVVQQGGTSGIAVSFHRDFYDVVMTKIKQRLGRPMQKPPNASMTQEELSRAINGPTAAEVAEKERLYESRLKEAANGSRKLVAQVMECINTLLRVSSTEKEILDAIGWLGESGVMKGAAASAVRQQGFDAAVTALNRHLSSAQVVQAVSTMYRKLLNEDNVAFLTSKSTFGPFLGILNCPTSSVDVVKITVDMFAVLVEPALDLSLRTKLRDFFTTDLQLEKSMIVAQNKFPNLSGDVLEWCNNQFSIGAADKPAEEKKLILSVVLGIMNSSHVYDYCTHLMLALIQKADESCRDHFVELGGINAMMKVLEDDNCISRCWKPAIRILGLFSGQAKYKPQLQALVRSQTLQEILMTCKADTGVRLHLDILVDLHRIFNDLSISLDDDTSEADINEQIKVLLDVTSTDEQLLEALAWMRSSKDMAHFAKEEVRKSGVDAIVATMKRYPNRILIIGPCTDTLTQLNGRSCNHSLIETEDTYSCLTSILKNTSDPLMISKCIYAMAVFIAADGPNKDRQRDLFVKLHVVETVVAAYQRCRTATDSFLRFCICHYSRGTDKDGSGQRIMELKEELKKYHLVRTILDALEKAFDVNPLSSTEQEFGWRVLDKIIKFMRSDFQSEFYEARGLEICAKILVSEDVDSHRVVPALGVMLSLSSSPEMKTKMNALHFTTILSQAIAAHQDSAEFITIIETINQNLA